LRLALQGPWQEKLAKALHEDFGKSPVEVGLTEIFPTLDNLKIIRKNLKRWSAPQKVKTPLPLLDPLLIPNLNPKAVPWSSHHGITLSSYRFILYVPHLPLGIPFS